VPTSRVLNTAGQVFSDISRVIVICDKEFIDIVTRQFKYRELVSKLEFSSEIEDLLMRLFRDLINMGLFSTIGDLGSSNTPIGKWFCFLARIELTGSHSEARDIIESYVEELAEIARKYIPEDIPLCVLVSEYSSPPTPDILYRTPLENTNTTSPDYSGTSRSSHLNSLVWVDQLWLPQLHWPHCMLLRDHH
jgi:hypothetical protein